MFNFFRKKKQNIKDYLVCGTSCIGKNFTSPFSAWNNCIGVIIQVNYNYKNANTIRILVEFEKSIKAAHDGGGLGSKGCCRFFVLDYGTEQDNITKNLDFNASLKMLKIVNKKYHQSVIEVNETLQKVLHS